MKCCDIHAGMLREPVTFQRMSRVSTGAGGFRPEWAEITGAPTKAHIKAMSGAERWASERTEATSRYRVTVRYFADLTEVDAVLIRGRRHNIRFIDNVEFRDRWLVIEVDGGVAT